MILDRVESLLRVSCSEYDKEVSNKADKMYDIYSKLAHSGQI